MLWETSDLGIPEVTLEDAQQHLNSTQLGTVCSYDDGKRGYKQLAVAYDILSGAFVLSVAHEYRGVRRNQHFRTLEEAVEAYNTSATEH